MRITKEFLIGGVRRLPIRNPEMFRDASYLCFSEPAYDPRTGEGENEEKILYARITGFVEAEDITEIVKGVEISYKEPPFIHIVFYRDGKSEELEINPRLMSCMPLNESEVPEEHRRLLDEIDVGRAVEELIKSTGSQKA